MDVRNVNTTWMLTFSGRRFYPDNPRPDDICLQDIAHGLAHICRFGGHAKKFYSVAQHSLLVSRLLRDNGQQANIQLQGLLHDASEAYLGDLVRPLKRLLPDYKELERKLTDIIHDKYGLTGLTFEGPVEHFDNVALVTERRDLLPATPFKWDIEEDYLAHPARIIPMSPKLACRIFHEKAMNLVSLV